VALDSIRKDGGAEKGSKEARGAAWDARSFKRAEALGQKLTGTEFLEGNPARVLR
jgi:hypothetical protein